MSTEKQQMVKYYGSEVDYNFGESHRKIILHRNMYFISRKSLGTAGLNVNASEQLSLQQHLMKDMHF